MVDQPTVRLVKWMPYICGGLTVLVGVVLMVLSAWYLSLQLKLCGVVLVVVGVGTMVIQLVIVPWKTSAAFVTLAILCALMDWYYNSTVAMVLYYGCAGAAIGASAYALLVPYPKPSDYGIPDHKEDLNPPSHGGH